MYKSAILDATDAAIKEMPTADIAKSVHLPEFILRGLVSAARAKVLTLTEAEAEKLLNSVFSIVDAFRERLTAKAIHAIKDDEKTPDEAP